jgi:hypothetical protein
MACNLFLWDILPGFYISGVKCLIFLTESLFPDNGVFVIPVQCGNSLIIVIQLKYSRLISLPSIFPTVSVFIFLCVNEYHF